VSQQLLLGVRLRDSSVFASYYAGPNGAAVDILKSLAPGVLPPCIFLQGGPGTGKSHLLQAVCAQIASRQLRGAYLPLEEVSHMGPELLSGWGELDVVCIDDVERVAGDAAWNRALFALHQQLEEHRGRLLVASSLAPGALRMTLPDLASRLAGGIVLTLHALSETEQIGALQLHAQLRGFELPEETATFMLRRLPRDMATLCRVLDELDEASLIAQRRLTVRFVNEVLKARQG
jgi:DnaA family protein